MISNLKQNISNHLINIPGWRSDRKIVVVESDDWGGIRMSSKKNLLKLSQMGINVQNCHYVQNDSLASEDDLTLLFDLLQSFKDLNGNPPVITANVILTNPDFNKIKEDNFKKYHYEVFTETLKKYSNHNNSFNLWKNGMYEGLFHPQFHGKEHLQVIRWMNFLRNSKSETRKAFDLGVCGLSSTVTSEERKSFMASYEWDDIESRDFILESVADGLSLFKSIFGFESLSSIAPNYIWHQDVEQVFRENGVRYIQGNKVQKSPVIGNKKFKKRHHFTGQKNNFGQRYLVRNCIFEPSSNPDLDWIDKCMSNIKNAFFWKKPAIIEMHRVNFIGFINSKNRDDNLYRFRTLLNKIIQTWPETEFMTSDQLGKLIEEDE